MRVTATWSVSALLLAILIHAPAALSQDNPSAATAQAPLSLEDIVPALPEIPLDQEQQVLPLPSGWHLVELVPGGFLLRHDDGSLARIVQCQQSTHYRLAWRIDYERDGVRYVSANVVRQSSEAGATNHTALRVRVPTECVNDQGELIPERPDGSCRAAATAIVAPWPNRLWQQLLNELNPLTRTGERAP